MLLRLGLLTYRGGKKKAPPSASKQPRPPAWGVKKRALSTLIQGQCIDCFWLWDGLKSDR